MINKVTSIKVHTVFEGLHRYPGAPEEVKDLKDLHRHIFHIRFQTTVTHSDRELEFFIVKHAIDSLIRITYPNLSFESNAKNLGACSCEMIAEKIYDGLKEQFGLDKRDTIIEVSEDDNNSGIVEYRQTSD